MFNLHDTAPALLFLRVETSIFSAIPGIFSRSPSDKKFIFCGDL
jgi:hypothetical protein